MTATPSVYRRDPLCRCLSQRYLDIRHASPAAPASVDAEVRALLVADAPLPQFEAQGQLGPWHDLVEDPADLTRSLCYLLVAIDHMEWARESNLSPISDPDLRAWAVRRAADCADRPWAMRLLAAASAAS